MKIRIEASIILVSAIRLTASIKKLMNGSGVKVKIMLENYPHAEVRLTFAKWLENILNKEACRTPNLKPLKC